MQEEYLVNLFTEVVLLMGMKGFNTLPFKWIIDRKMINEALINNNQSNNVVPITYIELVTWIKTYRYVNFKLDENDYVGNRKAMSICFNRSSDGMRTLVVFGDSIDKDESMDQIKNLIYIAKKMVQIKTNGQSENIFDTVNKCNVIYVVSKGVSSYTTGLYETFGDSIKYFTDFQILSRAYDHCMQSHFVNIDEEKKSKMLLEVHLNSGSIPSMPASDPIAKLLEHKSKSMNIIRRIAVSSEETEEEQIFCRLVR